MPKVAGFAPRRFWLTISAVALLTVAIVGLTTSSAATAPASTTASADLGSLAPISVPETFTPSQDASPLDQFQYGLLAKYPHSYAGLTVNPNGTYNVLEVGTNAAFETDAQNAFDALPTKLQVAVPTSSLQLTFLHAATPLANLMNTKDAIVANAKAGVYGTSVAGIGLDEQNNRVLVTHIAAQSTSGSGPAVSSAPTMAPSNSTEASLSQTYGTQVEFQATGTPTASGSGPVSDTPPWNGGDWLVDGNAGLYCTSGPGVHSTTTGQHFLLTAGHCGYEAGSHTDFYNTWIYAPVLNSSTYVGTEATWSIGGTTLSAAGLDMGNIPTSSSPLIWIPGPARQTMTGWALPPGGGTICEEGVHGGQLCGAVQGENMTEPFNLGGGRTEWVNNLIQSNLILQPGDSGGVAWEASIFGPLDVGTNVGVATDANGNPIGPSWQEEIEPELFVDGVYYGGSFVVNTGSNP